MIRKITALLAAVLLVVSLGSCKQEEMPPALTDAEAAARLQELVPDALCFMKLVYGEGLPAAEDAGQETTGGTRYLPVARDAAYRSVAQMKADAEKLFSSGYLDGTLYVVLFDGYTPPSETQKNETVVSDYIDPRYKEEDGVLYVDVNFNGFEIKTEPIPQSAAVLSGNDREVTVRMDYSIDGEVKGNMRVRLVLENGSWLLDSPVY